MKSIEHLVISILEEGPRSAQSLVDLFQDRYKIHARVFIYEALHEGKLRLNEDNQLEAVAKIQEPSEGDVFCERCYFAASPEEFPPATSVYHAFRCPVCGTTELDTSRCAEAGCYGDDNFLDTRYFSF